MTSKIFLDTNILVYATDRYDLLKQEKCRSVLRSIGNETCGVISTQVLQEFNVTVTKKMGVDNLAAKEILHSFPATMWFHRPGFHNCLAFNPGKHCG